jgi:mono/diheme cytochrome c family protein
MGSEAAAAITLNGRNNMPAFRDAYSIDELYDVAAYIVEQLAGD